jgi:hypothetical protein
MNERLEVKTGEEVKQLIIDELPTEMGDILETCKILMPEETERVRVALMKHYAPEAEIFTADNTPDADEDFGYPEIGVVPSSLPPDGPADEHNLEMGC